jgi:hypothetical protein
MLHSQYVLGVALRSKAGSEEVFFMYLLVIRKKNHLQANVMMYYNVMVGCSSSDVISSVLQVEGPASV